jgi:sterol 3beta-glucosyltransferase
VTCPFCFFGALLFWQEKLMRKLTTVQQDGIVDFDIEGSPSLAQVLFGSETRDEVGQQDDELGEEDEDENEDQLQSIPPLKIVMLVVGTRGDVQPFIGIGRKLQVLHLLSVCICLYVCTHNL